MSHWLPVKEKLYNWAHRTTWISSWDFSTLEAESYNRRQTIPYFTVVLITVLNFSSTKRRNGNCVCVLLLLLNISALLWFLLDFRPITLWYEQWNCIADRNVTLSKCNLGPYCWNCVVEIKLWALAIWVIEMLQKPFNFLSDPGFWALMSIRILL